MNHLREKIYTRGTADFPFHRYTFSGVAEGRVMAQLHWHPEMELLQVSRGELEVRVGREQVLVRAGQVAFISPGQLHSVRAVMADSAYSAFVFSLDLLSLPETHFFQRELIAPLQAGTLQFPVLPEEGDGVCSRVWAALDDIPVSAADGQYKTIAFSAMIRVFAIMMGRMQRGRAELPQNSSETVKRCLAYMQAHYERRLTLQELAQQVHLHPNYLCALFKDYTGKTVFAQLAAIRVEKAAELLRDRDVSVSTAAATCGFESPGFFTRKFKEIMGMTPKQYSLRYR